MKMRMFRWAVLTTGLVFGVLGLGGCGLVGWVAAGLVGVTLFGGGAGTGT